VKFVDGQVRVVDADGDVVTGKNGKPISLAEHIESFRTTYGDLFVTSQGGGAGGSGSQKPSSNGKLSQEAASELSMEDFMAARAKGRI
jgi:hypothetical protein